MVLTSSNSLNKKYPCPTWYIFSPATTGIPDRRLKVKKKQLNCFASVGKKPDQWTLYIENRVSGLEDKVTLAARGWYFFESLEQTQVRWFMEGLRSGRVSTIKYDSYLNLNRYTISYCGETAWDWSKFINGTYTWNGTRHMGWLRMFVESQIYERKTICVPLRS